METSGEFNQLCNQLFECQCACWAWQGAYATQADRNMQLCTEIEQLRSLVDAQQIRIAHVTKENQRLNLLMGHLMPRDVGPTTNYCSTDADSNEGNGETAETEKSEVVQRLETIVELSDGSSNTSKSEQE
ncbi:uncharacterized protein FRV6_08833 [Fusarium oxysporum]|uniref:Uncharacterized protein n=2 Tax=Fusarium oxysporum TaxID=5507 RepID=A0A2H3TN81_FUSOX|nr:hypothetical protein BFJ65_g8703 [Fusarium oxysporum f. sp. cepae]RKK34495.1 hypothetical protein BFJ67_g13773 [Fusarium oxysporum f. sp. cepae]RKK62132.1 hypothetical protein BFJ66_g940 [Fusarium oxysporum f. sp. cepae]SCO84706.1 uncharacterized protein FRV6_08833 [Fusarium oxysporum]